MAQNPQINYFSRDFQSLRSDLITWAKTYHADKLAYFNENNPDIMYLEMCAYVGDMLSYYIDKSFNENFRTTAQAKESLVRIANNLGFFKLGSTPASTQLIVSINVPAIQIGGVYKPDPDYLIGIQGGMRVRSDSGIYYEIIEEVNFADERNRTDTPNVDGNGITVNFTINKYAVAKAGTTKVQRFYISEDLAQPFLTITLDDIDVTEIIGAITIPGNQFSYPEDLNFSDPAISYLEVNYLAQSELFLELNPTQVGELSAGSIIKAGVMVPVSKRFVVRKDANGITYLTFGSNVISTTAFNQIIQNPINSLGFSYSEILNNTELGEIPPPNSTLFIKFRSGGGAQTDALAGQINAIVSKKYTLASSSINYQILQQVRNSLSVRNDIPAVGGKDIPTVEEIRALTGKVFAAQDRAVTYEDFKALISNMPAKFGQPYRIAYEEIYPNLANYTILRTNLFAKLDELLLLNTQLDRQIKVQEIQTYINGFSDAADQTSLLLNSTPTLWIGEKARMYVLGIDQDNKLVAPYKVNNLWTYPNELLKTNIMEWLRSKRLIGDWVDIVDGRVNNIQIDFTIIADKSNSQKVLIQCLQTLKDYFDINNWYMNHPIFLGNVQTTLQNLPGVINVVDLKIYNIFGSIVGPSPDFRTIDPESGREYAPPETGTYRNNNPSPVNIYNNKYLMNSVDNVILCWPDTIFEVKYPDSDIIGHVI